MFVSGQCNNGLETYHCEEIGKVKMGPLKTCTFDEQKLGVQKWKIGICQIHSQRMVEL